MLRIVFITGITHTPSLKNLNHFQRVYFLSRDADLTILGGKRADFSVSAREGTNVVCSPWPGKLGHLAYASLWLLLGGARNCDIILTEPSVLGICGFAGKLFGSPKWVVDVWDIPIRNYLQRHSLGRLRWQLLRNLMRLLYRGADLFIVSILPDLELRHFRIPFKKMLLLKNAIWLEEIRNRKTSSPPAETFDLLVMRSVFTPAMGLDTVARAFLILREEIPEISLKIIGRIPGEVRAQVAALDGLANVQFFDFVEHQELTELIEAASVCVVPFRDEPDLSQTYPIKILEYQASGRPVVASRIAGLSRMVKDGVNGFLFSPGDALDLAEKIRTLYHDSALRERLGANASELDQEFDCVNKNRKIMDRFVSLLEGH